MLARPVEGGRVVDREVGVQGGRSATHRLDVDDSGTRAHGIRAVVDADVVTVGGERECDGAAEPAARAGDPGRQRIRPTGCSRGRDMTTSAWSG